MKRLLLMLLMLIGLASAQAQRADSLANLVIPYTLADRDRALRMEAKLEMLDKRSEELQTSITSLTYLVLGGFLGLVGLLLWDRRTTVASAIRETANPLRRELDTHLVMINKLERE